MMKSSVVLVMSMLILSVLACAMDKEMGDLSVNSAPVQFTLYGETIYHWRVPVSPGAEYEIVMIETAEKQEHPANFLEIHVIDATDRGSDLVKSIEGNEDMVIATFIAPSSGRVSISVSSQLWDDQSEIGTLTIQIRD